METFCWAGWRDEAKKRLWEAGRTKTMLDPPVRPTVHTKRSRKRRFSKTLFKPEEFENAGFAFFVWKENILKTEFFENDDIEKIT